MILANGLVMDDNMQCIIKKLNLPEEAEVTFWKTYKEIKGTSAFQKFVGLIKEKHPFDEIENMCMEHAESAGINKYTYFMTLIISCVEILKQRYSEKGISDEIFVDTMGDIKCKVIECKNFHGVWGIFPKGWYKLFFDVKIIALGRLQYQKRILKDERVVYALHIPSSGPLKYEDVMKSYKKAYQYFDKTDGDLTAFVCGSYLLFPGYFGSVFKAGTNTYKFINDFNILKVNHLDKFNDAWRIFNMPYTGDISVLPQNTSLQKAFADYLKNDGEFGSAFGAFLFDGENILKEEAGFLRYSI